MLAVLFLVITIVFVVIHTAPGNPSNKFLLKKVSPKYQEQIVENYNLDKSVFVQYVSFISNIAHGNLGVSFNFREDVIKVIKPYFLFTLLFATASFIIQIFLSFLMVGLSLFSKSKFIEKVFTKVNLVLYSTPIFISSLFLVYIFSYKLNLLPSAGLSSIITDGFNKIELFSNYFSHLILPLAASVFVGLPIYYKYLLEAVKRNMNKNFISNLKILGLKRRKIFISHILPNSLNSFIAVAGVEFGVLLSGSVILESIFALPGLGRLTLNAVITRDYPLVIGSVIVSASMILLVNLIADLIRVFIDKRSAKSVLS